MPGASRFQRAEDLRRVVKTAMRERLATQPHLGLVGADVFPVPAVAAAYRDLAGELQQPGIVALHAPAPQRLLLQLGLAHLADAWLSGGAARSVFYPMTWPTDSRLVHPGKFLGDDKALILVDLSIRECRTDAWRFAANLAQARHLVVAGTSDEVEAFARHAGLADRIVRRAAPELGREALFPAVRWMMTDGASGAVNQGRIASLANELLSGRRPEVVYAELTGEPLPPAEPQDEQDAQYWAVLAHLLDHGLERPGNRRADKIHPALLAAAWECVAGHPQVTAAPPPMDHPGPLPPGFDADAFYRTCESQPGFDERAERELARLRLFEGVRNLNLLAIGNAWQALAAGGKEAQAINYFGDILALAARQLGVENCLARMGALRHVPIASIGPDQLAKLTTAVARKLAAADLPQELLAFLATPWVTEDLQRTLGAAIGGGMAPVEHASILRAEALARGAPDQLPPATWLAEESRRFVRNRLEIAARARSLDEAGLWLLTRLGGTAPEPEARVDALSRLLPSPETVFSPDPGEHQHAWRKLKTFLSEATAGDPATRRQAIDAVKRMDAARLALLPPRDVVVHQAQHVLSSLTKLDLALAKAFGRAVASRMVEDPEAWTAVQADSAGHLLSNLMEAGLHDEARRVAKAALGALERNPAPLVAHPRFPSLLNQLQKAAGSEAVDAALDIATPFLARFMLDAPGDAVDDLLVHFMERRARLVDLCRNNKALRKPPPFKEPAYGWGPRWFILHWIDARVPQRGDESFAAWGWVPHTPTLEPAQIQRLVEGRREPDGRITRYEGLQAKAYAIVRQCHEQWTSAKSDPAAGKKAFGTMAAVLETCAQAGLEWVPIHIARTARTSHDQWHVFHATLSHAAEGGGDGMGLEAVASVLAGPEHAYPFPMNPKDKLHVALSSAWAAGLVTGHATDKRVSFQLTDKAGPLADRVRRTVEKVPPSGAPLKAVLKGSDQDEGSAHARAIRRGLITWTMRPPEVGDTVLADLLVLRRPAPST